MALSGLRCDHCQFFEWPRVEEVHGILSLDLSGSILHRGVNEQQALERRLVLMSPERIHQRAQNSFRRSVVDSGSDTAKIAESLIEPIRNGIEHEPLMIRI